MYWLPSIVLCSIEKGMLEITNVYRRENNMPDLKMNESLQKVAQSQADYMCLNEKLTHDSPSGSLKDRLMNSGFEGVKIGENIAKQQGEDYKEVLRLWMRSDTHRKNIIGDLEYVGIGTCKDKKDNRYYVQVVAKNLKNERTADVSVGEREYIVSIRPSKGDNDLFSKEDLLPISKPLTYKIINQDKDSCPNLEVCEPGKMIRPINKSTDDGYRETPQSETGSRSISDVSEKLDSFTVKTLTRTNIIYKTITKENCQENCNSKQMNTAEPKDKTLSSVNPLQNKEDFLNFIPKYLESIKKEIMVQIKQEIQNFEPRSLSTNKTTTETKINSESKESATVPKSESVASTATYSTKEASISSSPIETTISTVFITYSTDSKSTMSTIAISEVVNSIISPATSILTIKEELTSQKKNTEDLNRPSTTIEKNNPSISPTINKEEMIKALKEILGNKTLGFRISTLSGSKISCSDKNYVDIGTPFID